MRRTLIGFGLAAAVAALPTAAYETLQKTAEQIGPRNGLLRLSVRAEESVRWETPTGLKLVDHALHELIETERFWTLTSNRLRDRRI